MVAPILGRYLISCGVVLGSAIGILPAHGDGTMLAQLPTAIPRQNVGGPSILDLSVEQKNPEGSLIQEVSPNLPKNLLIPSVTPITPVVTPVTPGITPITPVVTPVTPGITPDTSIVVPIDNDLGVLQILTPDSQIQILPPPGGGSTEPNKNSDLGAILIRPQPPVPPKPKPQPVPKSLYLIGRLDYFNNSNVLASPITRTDGALRSGLALYYAPSLGPKTFLLATTEAAMLRYGTLSRLNSDELRFKVGIYHQWTPKVSTEVGWSYYELSSAPAGVQQVFKGKRFFNEHSLRFDLIRQDELNKHLILTSIYQFRWNLAGDVEQYDRLVNNAIASLSYKLSPRTQAAVDYQYSWTHFIQQSRDDQTHFLGVRFSHSVNDRLQLSTFGGRNFGYSSESRVNPVGWIFGIGLGVNLPIL